MARVARKNITQPRLRDLGAWLESCWAAYATNRPSYEGACQKYDDELFQKLSTGRMTFERWLAADAEEAEMRAALGVTDSESKDEQLFDKVSAVMEQIKNRMPDDVFDLASIANACAAANHTLWSAPSNELDWEDQKVRHLVEAVMHLAGEPLMLNGLHLPQQIQQTAFDRYMGQKKAA